MNGVLLVAILGVLIFILGLTAGYMAGRYHTSLLDRIKTLSAPKEPEPEPEKPTVAGGAYQPPRELSSTADTTRRAGLVETKTPELLDWESKEELHKLEHGA